MKRRDLRKNKWVKLTYKIRWSYIRLTKIFSESRYIYLYHRLLYDYGMNIELDKGYIDQTAYFDNYDYSLITIGKNVTISKEVLMLTHDFSVNSILHTMTADGVGGYLLKPISVGNNCFIGARVTILPGTVIGDNSIVGACATVKGEIPKNSIVIGNPARIIGNTVDYGRKHLELKDYIECL